MSIGSIATSHKPTLSQIRKEMPAVLFDAVQILVGELAKSFNVGKQMTVEQIEETAKVIVQEFHWLRVDDLKLCFRRIRSGHFGQIFDRVDCNVICHALRLYEAERQKMLAQVVQAEEDKKRDKNEMYYLKTSVGYVRFDAENKESPYHEVETKALATEFKYAAAVAVKKLLGASDISIESTKKAGNSLAEWLQANQPRLLEEMKGKPEVQQADKVKAYEAKLNYEKRIKAIMEDTSLSELERENKRRDLSGLMPLTQEEFDNRPK